MGANLLRLATSLAKGFSQVYILMTLIPEMISFITLMRSSVRAAILDLKKKKFNSLSPKAYPVSVFFPVCL